MHRNFFVAALLKNSVIQAVSSQKETQLEIIGAGFGRTGTNSLKIAIETLGFRPCYHMYEVTQNPSHVNFWNKAASNAPVEWIDFFKFYKATVDWPASAFIPQIYNAFKSSKVIIAVKTPKSGADKRDDETIKNNGSSHIIDSSCLVMIDLPVILKNY